MRIAHLIMAYKSPEQIERLVRKMTCEGSDFFIHVDKKINITPFYYLESTGIAKLTKNRIWVNWAGFSFTNAILECIREIYKIDESYDFINVMSGQDYPIKSNEYIYNYFNNNIGKSFISSEPYGTAWWETAKHRVERYHLTDYPFKGHYRIQQLVNFAMPKRKFPLPYSLYGGNCSTWWTLSKECAMYVLQFLDNNHKVKNFSKFTWAPDEFLLPTIIMNSAFKEQVINNNLRYIDWSLGGANPKILVESDLQYLEQSNSLFARKFDITVDSKILDMLDITTQ